MLRIAASDNRAKLVGGQDLALTFEYRRSLKRDYRVFPMEFLRCLLFHLREAVRTGRVERLQVFCTERQRISLGTQKSKAI